MIGFHELALAEAVDAQEWYARRSLRAARNFRTQMDEAIAGIVADPNRFPAIRKDFQYARILGFPYIVVFRNDTEQNLVVYAIAHTTRRSGYWVDRK